MLNEPMIIIIAREHPYKIELPRSIVKDDTNLKIYKDWCREHFKDGWVYLGLGSFRFKTLEAAVLFELTWL